MRLAPWASPWTFVDDSFGRSKGIQEAAISEMTELVHAFPEGFQPKRLAVPDNHRAVGVSSAWQASG
eukprot:8303781-Pyramimonas_sp.AAC.1